MITLLYKRTFFLTLLFLLFQLAVVTGESTDGAEKYQINSVSFESRGRTDPEMLKRKMLPIETDTVFDTKEDFEEYLASIEQQLNNFRLLENITYTYNVIKVTDSGIALADVTYSFDDSSSFVLVPYPSYSSNSGAFLTLRINDMNFLGKTNPFAFLLVGRLGTDEKPNDFSKVTVGLGTSYVYPFYIGNIKADLISMLDFAWTLKEKSPVFDIYEGLKVTVPVFSQKLEFLFIQAAVKNKDFAKYDDEIYFNEYGKVSMPFVLDTIDTISQVVYRPFVSASYNWDLDGINKNNHRLSATPKVTIGQTTSIDHVNWEGNFRTGYAFSTTQSIIRNFSEWNTERRYIPYLDANIKLFKHWKYAGFTANLDFFTMLHPDESSLRNIGPRLRGSLDRQIFSNKYDSIDDYNYALETESAIIMSMELPIHIFSTHYGSSSADAGKFSNIISKLNFELQLAPYADIALLKNRACKSGENVGKTYDFREGIYCAGVEALIYPSHWKSYAIRISLGFDIGDKIIPDYNREWRKPDGNYELIIGFGHHF